MPDPIVDPDPVPTPTDPPVSKAPDLAKVVESLTAKHGSAEAAIRELVAENYKSRDALRELKGKLPPDGSLVLTPDDAKVLTAYKALGKPEDLKRLQTDFGAQGTELATLKRDDELRTVADKAGVKFAVLKTIAGTLDFTQTVKVKDAKTGKEAEVLAVKDGESDPVAFDDFARARWSDFLPALRPDAKTEQLVPPRRQAAPLPPVNPPKTQYQSPLVR